MQTTSFTTNSGQHVTILMTIITGIRRMNDAAFGPRTAVDTTNGAIYLIDETDEQYAERIKAWKAAIGAT